MKNINFINVSPSISTKKIIKENKSKLHLLLEFMGLISATRSVAVMCMATFLFCISNLRNTSKQSKRLSFYFNFFSNYRVSISKPSKPIKI